MNKFHYTKVVFRCPAELKDKMRAFTEERDQQLSTFARSAYVEVLRREAPSYSSPIDPREEIAG